MPLRSKDLGLVAGDVTGGGGKATKQKPNGTVHPLGWATNRESVLRADRRQTPRRVASGYKSAA